MIQTPNSQGEEEMDWKIYPIVTGMVYGQNLMKIL
jgi:hypothetical protein